MTEPVVPTNAQDSSDAIATAFSDVVGSVYDDAGTSVRIVGVTAITTALGAGVEVVIANHPDVNVNPVTIINPPTLVSDPDGDIQIGDVTYRYDPLAAISEAIQINIGG